MLGHSGVVVETLNLRLAKRIFAERTLRGVSQEHLAENAGLHRTYVGQIERGRANPSLGIVEKLAEALEVHSDVLLCSSRGHHG